MSETRPTREELIRSYEQALLARVQLIEFQSWGETITGSLRKRVVEHQELEARYVDGLIASRRSS